MLGLAPLSSRPISDVALSPVAQTFKIPAATLSLSAGAVALRIRYGTPAPTALTLSAQAPALRWIIKYTEGPSTLALASYAPAWRSVVKWGIPAQTLVVSTFTPTIRQRFAIAASTLGLTGQVPSYRSIKRFAVPASSLGLTGQTPVWRQLITTRYAIGAQTIALTTVAPSLKLRSGIPLATMALSASAPVFRQVMKFAVPAAASMALAASAPSFRQIMRVPAQTITLAPQTPNWTATKQFSVPAQTLTLTAPAPRFNTKFVVPANALALVPRIPTWRGTFKYAIPSSALSTASFVPSWRTFDPASAFAGKMITVSLSARPQMLQVMPRGLELALVSRSQESVLAARPSLDLSPRPLTGDTMSIPNYLKDPDEKLTIGINFAARLLGRTITSGSVVSFTQLSGPTQSGATISAMLSGAVISSPAITTVSQKITNGVVGCSFLLKLKAVLSDGDELVGSAQIDVQVGA